jgi:hypothetical protein
MIDKGWIEPGDGSNRARKESPPDIGQKRVYVIKSVFFDSPKNGFKPPSFRRKSQIKSAPEALH